MFFDLSKPQRLLQQSVRDFVKRDIPATQVREIMDTDSAHDLDLWKAMADQGWLGLHLPEEVEGMGLGVVELAVVAEELGRACAPGPWLAATWATTVLNLCEKHDLLPEAIDGESFDTVAHFEPESGWSQSSSFLTTTVDLDRQLNGEKHLVCNALQARLLICSALAETKMGESEFVVLAIPRNTPGVTISSASGMDQTRRSYQCSFEEIAIEDSWVIARGQTAENVWHQAALITTVATCAEMVGVMHWMLEATVEYANSRKQFDRPIGSFQAVQTKCADMLMLTESARSATWYAAWSLQEQEPNAEKSVAVAKAYTSKAVHQVGNMAIQAHGGIGFTWEHDLHLYYKRARANEFFLGDTTVHLERIAEKILD